MSVLLSNNSHKENENAKSEKEVKKKTEIAEVPCYPLYSIIQAAGNPVIDYMSLDVEGYELKVSSLRKIT